MPPRRSSYRDRWGSDFSFEPLHVYVRKEAERARDLVEGAARQKYGDERLETPGLFTRMSRQVRWAAQQAALVRQELGAPEPQGGFRERAASRLREGKTSAPDGGGFFGSLKRIGSGAMDVLDAATETTTDLLEQGSRFPGNPLFLPRAATDVVQAARGRNPLEEIRKDVTGRGTFSNLVESRFNPREFSRRQTEDFRARPLHEQIALGVVNDPTNVIGLGAVTKGLRAAQASRRAGSITGRLFGGAARANEVLDAAQARYAREIGGAVLGGGGTALAGGDTKDILAGAAGGAVLGRLSRSALRRGAAQARVLREAPVGLGITDEGDAGIRMREGFETLRHSDIKERPDLFQARDADPGRAFKESKVREIVEDFDPLKLEPGLVAHDRATGDYVVLRGHHRLEAQRRLAQQGAVPETGTWQVVDADLSDPEQVNRLRRLAQASNYTTSRTNLREDLRAARDILDAGEGVDGIIREMRANQQYAQDLSHLAALPDDMIDRAVQFGRYDNLAEIARAAQLHDLSEQDIRALAGRFAFDGPSAGVSRTYLRRALDEASQVVRRAREAQQARMQGALFDTSAFEEAGLSTSMLDVIDEMTASYQDLAATRRRLNAALKGIGEIDDPELMEARARLEDAIRAKIQAIEEGLSDARARIQEEAVARFEGRAAEDAGPGDRPGGGGSVQEGGRIESPPPGPEQADIFGGRTRVEPPVEQPPAGQQGLDLEGGSRGQKVPSNQETFLGMEGQAETARVRDLPEGTYVRAGSGAEGVVREDNYGNRIVRLANGGALAGDAQVTVIRRPEEFKAPASRSAQIREERAAQPAVNRDAVLPGALRGAKPRYNFGSKSFTLNFDSDVDKALYIVAQPNPSKRDADYMAFLREALPGRSDTELRQLGKAVRDRIKVMAREAPAGRALRVEAGQHELGPVRGLDEPKEFPRQLQGDTTVEVAPPGFDPQRATQQALGGELDRAPRQAPVGRVGEDARGAARGADAVFGEPSGAATPPGAPPAPPQGAPPPREPGPGNPQRAFGQEGETVDLLRGRPRERVIAEAEQAQQSLRGRARQRFRESHPAVDAVRREKERTDQLVKELVDAQVDSLWARAERAGLRVEWSDEAGWVLQGHNVPIEDVVEQSTEAGRRVYAELSAEQRAVLDEIEAVNDAWNRTVEAHGGTVPKREEIEGQYFPRRVTGREVEGRVIDKTRGTGTSRRLGASRIGRRTQESVEAGVEEGLRYAHPKDALKAGIRTKARMAQDAYLTRMIEPLAVDAKPGFGVGTLPGHPALTKKRVVGTSEGGAAIMVDEPLAFPEEIANQLRDVFESRSIVDTKPGQAIRAVTSVATPLRASTDISFLLNQGLGLLESSPRNLGKGLRGVMKVVGSAMGDPDQYYRLLDEEIQRGPGLDWHVSRGLHYAGEDAAFELQFPKRLEDIPGLGRGVQWSNETFGRYLNYARMVLANDAYERAVAQGLSGEALDREMESALEAVNRMTGWSSGRPTGIEQLSLFAPRFFRANVGQIVAAFTKGGLEGRIARRQLLNMTATAAVLAYVVNAARGYNTDIDPRSHNFLRMRNVFGQDISPFGPFATIIRGAAQVAGGRPTGTSAGPRGTGLVWGTGSIGPDLGTIPDFARTKAGPVAGTVWSLLAGETFDRRPVEQNPLDPDFAKTVFDIGTENVPFSVQALVREGPIAGAISSLGAQGTEVTPTEKADFARHEVAQELYGAGYDDLTATQKANVNLDERVAKHIREARRRRIERVGDSSKRAEIDQSFRVKMEANAQYLENGVDENGRPFSGNDYREAYHNAARERRAALETLEEPPGGDKVLDGYFELYDEATMPNGDVNFEKFERLAAEYERQHPDIQEKLDSLVGTRDDPTMQRFRKAQKQARDYYSIPAYRGFSVEQGERINELMRIANGYVQAGVVPSRRGAYQLMLAEDMATEDEVRMALRAQRVGTNPARKQFRLEHPEFREFYSDAPLVGQFEAVAVSPSSRGRSGGGLALGSTRLGRSSRVGRRLASGRRR